MIIGALLLIWLIVCFVMMSRCDTDSDKQFPWVFDAVCLICALGGWSMAVMMSAYDPSGNAAPIFGLWWPFA